MWMLTGVLDRSKLGRAQIIPLYHLRWGIELEFRGLKQTLNRAKLRCRNDRRLLAELHWSLKAMAVAELFALKELLRQHATGKVRLPSRRNGTSPISCERCAIAFIIFGTFPKPATIS
jgi:hypothetical protein